MVVSRTRKTMEIITSEGTKQTSVTVGPKELNRLRGLLRVAGLPPQAVKAQIAIKMVLSNYEKWGKTEDKELAQLFYNLHNALASAYNSLAEYNTKEQRENIQLLSDSSKKDN